MSKEEKIYVYSTKTCSTVFRITEPGQNDLPRVKKEVLIAGGANVSNAHLISPLGVLTVLSKEDYEAIKGHPMFKRQVHAGFLSVRTQQVDVEVAAAEMETRDNSAPLVDGDFTDPAKAPKTNVKTGPVADPVTGKKPSKKK